MSSGILIAVHVGLVILLILAHECGHYLAGRIVGIPGGQMAMRLLAYPPHVALGPPNDRVGPRDSARYAQRIQQLCGTNTRVFLFVGAGLMVQLLFALIGSALLAVLGPAWLGARLVMLSASLLGAYLGIDLLLTLVTGHPAGDLSGMLAASRVGGALAIVALAGIHVLALAL